MPLAEFLSTICANDPFADPSAFIYGDDQGFGKASARLAEFEQLITTVRPSAIIEVGTWKGRSANAMADICRRLELQTKIICVDTWLGMRETWVKPDYFAAMHLVHGRPTLYERFMGNVVSRGNQDMIVPLPLTSRSAAQVLAKFAVRADLIYVDAGHDYAHVWGDLTSYHPLLSSKGIMFGDDFKHPPVAQAVHRFASSLRETEVRASGGTWVLAPKNLHLSLFSTVVPEAAA